MAAGYAADPTGQSQGRDPLIGRMFKIAIAFGCDGPQGVGRGAQAQTQFDPEKRTLRIVARPGVWTGLPLISSLPQAAAIESVEGFWIPRPWALEESCPPQVETAPVATPSALPAPSFGLAQIFLQGSSRLPQRGERGYQVVRKIPENDPGLLNHAYRLVLEGQIAEFEDGRAVRCWAESAYHRPMCVLAVALDRVAIADAATGEELAEWRN